MNTTAATSAGNGTATRTGAGTHAAAAGTAGARTVQDRASRGDTDGAAKGDTDGAPGTGNDENGAAAPQDAEALIAGERVRIDQLDARIIWLVRERLELSENIQRIRIESGGRRVHLSREMEILDHYSTELGRPGRDLAMTLLGLCRGQ
ncbi:chorismate mutase [Streptomyces iconiensis]|uniref:Chorismate mutase n=1 Tax=Streptomyces iconiensis TaxID=1384038 RepID=A0ABT7A3M4_9ACTN|nr:chorismate mutase [Streptomyces iconiensis]MDJ1135949.1 chorismate mutase [Streptomyces iconiensis]